MPASLETVSQLHPVNVFSRGKLIWTYPSIGEACRMLGTGSKEIDKAIKEGGSIKGYEFTYWPNNELYTKEERKQIKKLKKLVKQSINQL